MHNKSEGNEHMMESYLPMSKLLTQLRKHFRCWLLLAVGAGVIVLALHFVAMPQRGRMTAVVNYSYDGIELGADPTGNHFDPTELKSVPVIRRAADSLEMLLSDEEIERIRSEIMVIGSVPESVLDRVTAHESIYGEDEVSTTSAVQSTSYYPTQYTVTFDFKPLGYSAGQAESLFRAILSSYETYFFELYGYNASIERSVQAIDYGEYDYDRALDVLDNSLVLLRGYLNRLTAQDSTRFISQNSGYSFSDLTGAIDTIRSEDIEWISAYIISNNITKSRLEQIDYYNYRIEAARREQATLQARLGTLDALIEGYTKTSTVILSAVGAAEGGEANGYEITRQSEMYDSLINQRIECQTSLSETQEQIRLYETRVERLNGATMTGNAAVVEEALQEVDGKVKRLLADTGVTAREYFENVHLQRAFQIVDVSNGSSLSLGRLISNSLRDGLAVEAFLFGAYTLYAIVSAVTPQKARTKAEKKQARKQAAQSDRQA